MQSADPVYELPDSLVKRILERLELSALPATDEASLQVIYAAWCRHLPFDNLRKMIALRTGDNRALPGLDANEFFETWLNNGSGATCWPMANAFYVLLSSLGFRAFRIAGSMMDLGILNHGSVKVFIHDREYLADASLLLNNILPLGEGTVIHDDPVFPVELEPDQASQLIWMNTPPNEHYFYCRMITDPVAFSVFEERYEASRAGSIFNNRLYARRNYPGELVLLLGNTRFSKTVKGIEQRELTRKELCEALHIDMGIAYPLINEWVASGSLDATFENPRGPHPPVITTKPPSQR